MQRSKIALLPGDVHAELDRKLVEGAFSDYRGLSKWLSEKGFQISHASVQRYSVGFEKRLSAVTLASKQAEAVAEAAPDREGAMTDALTRLIQQKIFATLVEVEDMDEGDMAKLARAVADLGRATISQKRWAEEVRSRLDQQKRAAGERVSKLRATGGLSDEAATEMRNILLGIDPLPVASQPTNGVRL
jgi:Protein of unknown function (DUF3486)